MNTWFKVMLIIFICLYLFDGLAEKNPKYRIISSSIGAAIAVVYIAARLLL